MRKERWFLIKLKVQRFCRPIVSFVSKVKMVFSFPHIWTCLLILCLAIIALIISYRLDEMGEDYWASILANVSAGLVTGIVICLVGGIKQISVTKIKLKLAWLNKVSDMITQFNTSFASVKKLHFERYEDDDKVFDLIYSAGSHANWINEEILQRSFDKTLLFNSIKYCNNTLGYDALALADDYEELHDKLRMIDVDYPSSKEIIEYFSRVNKELHQLGSAIYTEKKKLEIRLSEIQNTII